MKSKLILEAIVSALDITMNDLLERGQRKEQLYARYIAIGILREEGFNNNDIAKLFTKWSRNCIANSCKYAFNDLIQYNREFKDMYLLAVQAVEELDYESKNDSSAA